MSTTSSYFEQVMLAVSSFGAAASAWVGYRLYAFQKMLEEQKHPKVTLWFHPVASSTELGFISIINLGATALPFHRIEVKTSDRTFMLTAVDISEGIPKHQSYHVEFLGDLVLVPNIPLSILVRTAKDKPTQFQIRIMYYDNQFEFIEIDTAKFGPYPISGPKRTTQSS